MSYLFRFYRFPKPSGFAVAWVEAGLPIGEDGQPDLPGGAVDVVGNPPPAEEGTPAIPPGWYVNAAWPGAEPPNLAAFAIAPMEGLRVFAGWSDAAPPAPVPVEVTNFQARAALMTLPGPEDGQSLFQAVNAALLAGREASPEGAFAWQAWEQANTFTRNGATVNALAAQFGLSQAQLDDLFRAAVSIEA